jgi:predicted small metal-binding protein
LTSTNTCDEFEHDRSSSIASESQAHQRYLFNRTRTKRSGQMKSMTCRELGGPCDVTLQGDSADEIIKKQDKHLQEMVNQGDRSHEEANREMRARWKHPVSGMKWYRKAKKDFAALPDH